jgi:hypothetical protein
MAGLFGLGGPEMIALLCIASQGLAAAAAVVLVVLFVTRDRRKRLGEDED